MVVALVVVQEVAQEADQDPATGAVALVAAKEADQATMAVSPGAGPVVDQKAAEVAEEAEAAEAADQDLQEVELIAGLSPTYPVKWEEKFQPENKCKNK